MRRRDSDLLSLVRPPRHSYSHSYSQCSSRSRSGSFESDVRWSERASSVASDLDFGSELLDVDDLQLLQQHKQQQQAEGRETVRVTVRFRPLLAREKGASKSAWTVHADTGTVEAAPAVPGQNARRRGVYAFDEVYDAQHSTRAIYDGLARSIARSALDGIHGSIFAYGQTSSGKTHTMQGTALRPGRRMTLIEKEKTVETEEDRRPEDSDGLVQLAVKDLFDEMARRSDVEYLVRVSYLEVYNETVKDLLARTSTATGKRRDSTVHIREHPVTGVFTDNSERVVTDARGVLQALRDGEKQRAVGVTRMNERSSRSHSIFRVVIESKTRLESPVPTEDDTDVERVRVGCLNFVDLAGSESARAVSSGGKRLTTESGNINRSLLALSRVVVALGSSKSSNQQDHINFRDSKLTRILQPSLSGAARVLFVCCASPAPAFIEDTRSTLKFASRAKRIKVNASVNEVVDQRARALMELARENQLLRQQLDALATASRDEMDAMEEHAARLRMRIVSLEAAAAAPAWTSSVVIAPAVDTAQKSRENRQPEVTGLEGANSPTDSDNQALEPELSDDEGTEVDSQFDSPTGSPLLVADAACPTCETLDDALEIAKTREMESYLRIEELEQQIALLQREHEEDNSTVSEADKEDESTTESQCVLDVEDDEADETEALSGNGGISSVVHASSVSLASAALLALVVESLKKRSPTEALAIVVIALTCMGIMLASFAWNIATATL
ncbi:kinesin-like protein [Phytophthora cinnamomi]|uniref:kinesin-like protein n=2 Tax=Phytophthora cinnamomi TaxID=4785 RepID=UPI0035599300|nr:kinesin-like protein [Phytophthora cinnamomi]